ncbi:VTT domain-containing protein [Clostridium algidicarnis]|nr:VTT domain-containing protein [Clostridium algidicarnis]
MKPMKKTKLLEKLRYLPLIFMGIFFVYFAFNFRELSVSDILNYTPSNYFLAGAIMVSFFAIKSISVVIPLTLLYISSSIIFSWYWAIIVNLIGLFVSMTIPYYIGKFSGKDVVDKLMSKYPKINKVNDIKAKNQWVFVFIVKILGFIPNDVSSIVLGSLNTDYKAFIISSVLAKTPMMLAKTLIGANINQPGSKGFKVAILISILVFIFTVVIYWKNKDINK